MQTFRGLQSGLVLIRTLRQKQRYLALPSQGTFQRLHAFVSQAKFSLLGVKWGTIFFSSHMPRSYMSVSRTLKHWNQKNMAANFITCVRMIYSTSVSYSVGPHFKCGLTDWKSSLRYSVVFLRPFRQIPWWYLQLGHNRFHQHDFKFIIYNHPNTRHRTV
jgi:hypothetical protein